MDSGGKFTVRTFFRLRPTEGTIAPIRYIQDQRIVALPCLSPQNPQIKRCTSARVPIPPAGLAVRAGGGGATRPGSGSKVTVGRRSPPPRRARSQSQARSCSIVARAKQDDGLPPVAGQYLIWSERCLPLAPWAPDRADTHARARTAHARSARRDADAGGLRLRCP
jgi:hypothetical protein